MRSSNLKGILLCLAATMSWGVMFPVMGSALRYIDPFTLIDLRYLIAAAVFVALLVAKEGWASLDLRGERAWLAWFFGTAGFAGFNFLIFRAQQMIGKEGVLTASIFVATSPMLALLTNWALRRVAPPAWSFLFICLSFFGVLLVITKGNLLGLATETRHLGASAMMLAATFCWVLYTMGGGYFPAWSAYRYTAITNVLSLISMGVITTALYGTGVVPVPAARAVALILPQLAYIALIAGFFGILAWNMGVKILTPVNGVLFMNMVPLTAFIVSALLGTAPVPAQIAGALVTGTALVLNNFLGRRLAAAQNGRRTAERRNGHGTPQGRAAHAAEAVACGDP